MTIGITGRRRRAPWRGAVVALIIAAIVVVDLPDPAGAHGRLPGRLAVVFHDRLFERLLDDHRRRSRSLLRRLRGDRHHPVGEWIARVPLARSPWTQRPADFEWKRTGVATLPDVLEFMRHRLPWPLVIAGGAGLLAVLVAWGEVHNWGVFLRFLYQVPYGANDPLYDKDIGFYLFSLPAYVVIKNWMLLTLFLSALFAGAVYWVHGDIEYDAQRRSMSPTAIAHGSVLLGFFFAVKAWSYGLDRYLLLYGDNGVVVGASYTDIHVELPVLWLLIGLSIVAAFACVGEPAGAHLPASRGSGGACLRRLLRAVRGGPSDYSSACSSNQTSCSWRSPTSSATSR